MAENKTEANCEVLPHGSRCEARTRLGTPCKNGRMANGRCRMHGGCSTGPKTEAGRRRIAEANTKHGAYSRDQIQRRKRIKEIKQANTRLLERLADAGIHLPPIKSRGELVRDLAAFLQGQR